jgi:hypothetical protein
MIIRVVLILDALVPLQKVLGRDLQLLQVMEELVQKMMHIATMVFFMLF